MSSKTESMPRQGGARDAHAASGAPDGRHALTGLSAPVEVPVLPVPSSIPTAATPSAPDRSQTPAAPACGQAISPPQGAHPGGAEPGMLFFGANRRSGTTWLTGILNAHPEISCRNEGWLLTHRQSSAEHWLNKDVVRTWSRMSAPKGQYVRQLGQSGLERAMQRGMIREVVKQAVLAEGWKDFSRLKWMGDKTTTHYCTKVEFLHDLFPDARFISMVRDGRDVCVSDMFLQFRSDRLGEDIELSIEHIRDVRRVRKFHVEGQGEPVSLFTPATLSYFANNWAQCVSGGLRAKDLYAERCYEIRYETMVADPIGTVRDLYRWLEVKCDDAFVNWVVEQCKFENFSRGRSPGQADPAAEWRKGIIGDWRNYFTESDKALFKRLAGGMLVELGYENDLRW